jgi:hypothetical protein
MKTFLADFNAKVRREVIFKPLSGNESLREIGNDNGVRVVKLPQQEIQLSRVQCSHIQTFLNKAGLLLMEKYAVILITS